VQQQQQHKCSRRSQGDPTILFLKISKKKPKPYFVPKILKYNLFSASSGPKIVQFI
jgi:hypothetical protein